MSWVTSRLVEFQHCDPAGIVFYPRYFEMINSVIEEFFRDHLRYSFAPMHFRDRRGVPTVRISVEFSRPSRLDDLLEFEITIKRVGNSSLELGVECSSGKEARFFAQSTLVRTDLDTGRSDAWPRDIKTRLMAT